MVSIRLVMNGGIIDRANRGVQDYSVAEEKEQIQLGYKEYQMAKYQEANPTLKVEGATNVTPKDGGGWTVTFPSGRVYEVAADGTITGGETANLPEDSVASLAKAGEIQRWDRINYDPGTATTASITLPAGASLDGTISASSATDWVVLDVNQTTGEVLIMPTTVSNVKLSLEGIDGYNNAIEAMNAVASIYKNPAYATNSRSITVEDVNKVEAHTPNGDVVESTFDHIYGMDNDLNIISEGVQNKPSRTYKSTAETGSYSYELNSNIRNLTCWLASRSVKVFSNACNFNLRMIYFHSMTDWYLFNVHSNGSIQVSGGDMLPVVPVVTLKNNINIECTSTYIATSTVTGVPETHHKVWSFK